jgi:DnaK suppressor protein
MTSTRDAELRSVLIDHRTALEHDVRARLRAGRDDRLPEGRDDMQQSDDNIQSELSFSLLEMQSAALANVEAALARLDAGHYGTCAACDRPIPSRRLRALPFAVRCQPCADQRERATAGPATASRWGPASGDKGGVPA